MAKKIRENRVPIMLSEPELEAIDTWRYANRVATRSDAIRRLSLVGRMFDEQADALEDDAKRAVTDLSRASALLLEIGIDHVDEDKRSAFAGALLAISEVLEEAVARAIRLGDVTEPIRILRKPGDMRGAVVTAAAVKERMAAMGQEAAADRFTSLDGLARTGDTK